MVSEDVLYFRFKTIEESKKNQKLLIDRGYHWLAVAGGEEKIVDRNVYDVCQFYAFPTGVLDVVGGSVNKEKAYDHGISFLNSLLYPLTAGKALQHMEEGGYVESPSYPREYLTIKDYKVLSFSEGDASYKIVDLNDLLGRRFRVYEPKDLRTSAELAKDVINCWEGIKYSIPCNPKVKDFEEDLKKLTDYVLGQSKVEVVEE